MKKVAVVGCGVVGSSWALVFARAGLTVHIYDRSPAAVEATIAYVKSNLSDETVVASGAASLDTRLLAFGDLEETLAGVDYIQESSPERLEIKLALYKELDALAPPNIIIGSSTSGLPASSFTESLQHRARCLVVHPINPPHLIPLVELVPAPWTAADVTEQASAWMEQVGQSPVRLSREVNGFLVNRLQSALLAEAFKLVEDGICSAEDVDKAVADGLGLRWFFMGPFQTIDLNAQNGIAEYCKNLGPMYYDLAKEQAQARDWAPELVSEIAEQFRRTTPSEKLPAKRAWRDRVLAAVVEAKNKIIKSESIG